MEAEATQGISLYSYLYLKPAKTLMSFLLSLMFSLQQNRKWCLEVVEGEGGGGVKTIK
jgi:hypothetical protein